jgi:branched-chain amino acid transport system ATP-binding protein
MIMMDEPTLGLAPVVVDRIISTILSLRNDGRSVLLVEQDTTVALACSDRAYVLANGSTVLSGSSTELKGSAALLNAYIGSAPNEATLERAVYNDRAPGGMR